MNHYRILSAFVLLLFSFSAMASEDQSQEDLTLFSSSPSSLVFLENKGQIRDQYGREREDIDARLEAGDGLNIFIGKGGIHYQWSKPREGEGHGSGMDEGGLQDRMMDYYRMDVELLGAHPGARLEKGDRQEYYERYYSDWSGLEGTVVHAYRRWVYREVYPGIDWVLYLDDQGLKYDFLVHPGADPAQIRLQYRGADSLYLDKGELVAVTPMGVIREGVPYAYEMEGGGRVSASYRLEGEKLQFDLGAYEGGLVIDPALDWVTYYGASELDYFTDLAVDSQGFLYVVGSTRSLGNIATVGAHQSSNPWWQRVGMLVKFNLEGQRLWGTYYGGELVIGYKVVLDHGGNIYMAGVTSSDSMIATPGAHQTSRGGKEDLFLTKFRPDGQRIWGTYYGGSELDHHNFLDMGLCVDPMGSIIMASTTNSSQGISTPGSHQPVKSLGNDGFLVKWDSAGVRQWGTYFGGSGWDGFSEVSADNAGNLYVVGATNSPGMATVGAHQPNFGGGTYDGLLAKFDSSGNLVWSTYYGGSRIDWLLDLISDTLGNTVMIGVSGSADSISTPGSYKPSLSANLTNRELEVFLARFDSSGTRQWGTYYGMPVDTPGDLSSFVQTRDLAMDGKGNIIVLSTVIKADTSFVTWDAHQATISPFRGSMAIGILSPEGNQHLWGSYFGGDDSEWSSAVEFSGGSFYICGMSTSCCLATSGAHQANSTPQYNGEAILLKFDIDTLVKMEHPFLDSFYCAGDSIHLPFEANMPFRPGNTFTLQLSDELGSFSSPVTLASLVSTESDTFHGQIPLGAAIGVGYRLRIVSSRPETVSADNGRDIHIDGFPGLLMSSSNSPLCEGDSLILQAWGGASGAHYAWEGPGGFYSPHPNPVIGNLSLSHGGIYTVRGSSMLGCSVEDQLLVTVNPRPAAPSAMVNHPLCEGGVMELKGMSSTPGVHYHWEGPNGFVSVLQNPVISPIQLKDSGDYRLVVEKDGCFSDTAGVLADVQAGVSAAIYVSPGDTLCAGGTATFVVIPQHGGLNPQVQWYRNGQAVPGATGNVWVSSSIQDGDSVYCRIRAINACAEVQEIYTRAIRMKILPGVRVSPRVTVTASPSPPLPDQFAVFTAVGLHGGSEPRFQWQRNGVDVAGAVNATFSVSDLRNQEEIRCIYTSNDICADPRSDTSASIVVEFPAGIADLEGSGFRLFPNPNSGQMVIEGRFSGSEVALTLANGLGQVVYRGKGLVEQDRLKVGLEGDFPAGIYLLRVEDGEGIRQFRIRLSR